MFDDSLNLAENKLVLLYIIENIDLPISNIQLTQIVLENNLLNYFTLQQYIVELVSSDLINIINYKDKDRLIISDKGKEVLSLFKNRLPSTVIENIDGYIKSKISIIKKELTVFADYTIENSNSYLVNLSVAENDTTIIDLKVSVASNKQARELCYKWKNNASDLYNKIINALIE